MRNHQSPPRTRRIDPSAIYFAPIMGSMRPVLVLWVDDNTASCLVAAITNSTTISPRYAIPEGLPVTGSVAATVVRLPIQCVIYERACDMPVEGFSAIKDWLRREIDL